MVAGPPATPSSRPSPGRLSSTATTVIAASNAAAATSRTSSGAGRAVFARSTPATILPRPSRRHALVASSGDADTAATALTYRAHDVGFDDKIFIRGDVGERPFRAFFGDERHRSGSRTDRLAAILASSSSPRTPRGTGGERRRRGDRRRRHVSASPTRAAASVAFVRGVRLARRRASVGREPSLRFSFSARARPDVSAYAKKPGVVRHAASRDVRGETNPRVFPWMTTRWITPPPTSSHARSARDVPDGVAVVADRAAPSVDDDDEFRRPALPPHAGVACLATPACGGSAGRRNSSSSSTDGAARSATTATPSGTSRADARGEDVGGGVIHRVVIHGNTRGFVSPRTSREAA